MDRYTELEELRWWFRGSNLLIILLLILCNTVLIVYLKRKERIMADKLGRDSGVYQSEKVKLISIALLFVLSYILDVAYEIYVLSKYLSNKDDSTVIMIE